MKKIMITMVAVVLVVGGIVLTNAADIFQKNESEATVIDSSIDSENNIIKCAAMTGVELFTRKAEEEERKVKNHFWTVDEDMEHVFMATGYKLKAQTLTEDYLLEW